MARGHYTHVKDAPFWSWQSARREWLVVVGLRMDAWRMDAGLRAAALDARIKEAHAWLRGADGDVSWVTMGSPAARCAMLLGTCGTKLPGSAHLGQVALAASAEGDGGDGWAFLRRRRSGLVRASGYQDSPAYGLWALALAHEQGKISADMLARYVRRYFARPHEMKGPRGEDGWRGGVMMGRMLDLGTGYSEVMGTRPGRDPGGRVMARELGDAVAAHPVIAEYVLAQHARALAGIDGRRLPHLALDVQETGIGTQVSPEGLLEYTEQRRDFLVARGVPEDQVEAVDMEAYWRALRDRTTEPKAGDPQGWDHECQRTPGVVDIDEGRSWEGDDPGELLGGPRWRPTVGGDWNGQDLV